MKPTKPDSVREAERAAVVRYLKQRADNVDPATRLFVRDLADEIESGRHRR